MKCFAIVLLLAVAASNARQLPAGATTAYGYLKNIGIPEAERIRKAEEQQLSSKIAGGIASIEGQFPWQAGLISDIVGINGNGVCGGSLVSADRVITAAHCWNDGVNQAWRFTVVLGSTTLFTGGQRILTSATVTHSGWFPLLARNDVAVIYLPEALTFTSTLQPIALPSGSQLYEAFTGESATVSGFGIQGSDASISNQQYLSHVSVNVISNTICRFSFPLHLTDNNICTSGAGGTSPCQGDSGGPLYITRDGQPTMIGIVSFGSAQGCDSGSPAVYARTTEFMDFFNSHIN